MLARHRCSLCSSQLLHGFAAPPASLRPHQLFGASSQKFWRQAGTSRGGTWALESSIHRLAAWSGEGLMPQPCRDKGPHTDLRWRVQVESQQPMVSEGRQESKEAGKEPVDTQSFDCVCGRDVAVSGASKKQGNWQTVDQWTNGQAPVSLPPAGESAGAGRRGVAESRSRGTNGRLSSRSVAARPQFETPTHGRACPGDSEPVLDRHILNAVWKLLPRCDGVAS
ncbi:hypothetical protein NDU88_005851 [Pleurodeles waltl]|uniref:Uncharacterized protein n=1 Tax=Pleurodeles waltl TaxID=8319 RepID=A0AAV7MKN0_PLEWA|nr:hypothetical protein NDU88_005851 [Pleurodeles waltl]